MLDRLTKKKPYFSPKKVGGKKLRKKV
uniref:Uncharacterized protein n=1 Tax=Rhizophora mucronata TaxID=61149 RepID=A0A2P2QCQ1_RHIMU